MSAFSSVLVLMMIAGAASADELCHRQDVFGVQDEQSRECRFSRLFEGWLASNGFESVAKDARPLSVRQSVDSIGSSLGREFLPNQSVRPAATISLAYFISREETERMVATHELRPGFFESLDATLREDGRDILCETMGSDEDAFVSAGGVLTFEVGLRPGIIQSGYPDWLTRVEIDQSSCEAL